MSVSLKAPVASAPPAPGQMQTWRWYNHNPDYEPSVLPNGSIANFTDWKKVQPYVRIDGTPARAMPVTDHVWMLSGFFYAPVVIERPNGLLVFSSGENEEEGSFFRSIIRRDISTKPVIALFYDHAHYAKGARTLLDGDKAMIIAHPDSDRTVQESGFLSNPYISELLPTLDGRARIHFGTDLPETGPDAKLGGAALDLGKKSAWLPVTRTLAHGETIVVDGLELQAFHAVTDTQDTLTFWVPETKLVIDNVLWPTVPNLYTLRGDRYRDPALWIAALKQIRDLEPEIELDVGGGAKALYGKETIRETLNAVIDAAAFIYDQSIRRTNQGIRMQELRHHISMPASLLTHPYVNEGYGQFDTWPEAIAGRSHGWFSGYAEDLHSLPRAVESRKWVDLAGGEPAVFKAHRAAMENKEYLWAKDLAVCLYDVAPENRAYRQALADVFRALGRMSPGSIVRHFYIAAARSLEGETVHTLASVQSADWIMADVARAVDHLRTRLDPDKAADKEGVLEFDFGDKRAALHVRNSVAEFVPNPDRHYRQPTAVIRTTPEDFTRYFRGEISTEALLKQSGADAAACELLALFEEWRHAPMYQPPRREG
jgi:linear primary-alkylsulfatase